MRKKMSAFLSLSLLLQWSFTPLAQAKDVSKRQEIAQSLKDMGWGPQSKMTFGEFYSKNRNKLPESLRFSMDYMASQYRMEKMPKVELTEFSDKNKKDQVRIILYDGNETFTISTETAQGKNLLRMNGVAFEAGDFGTPVKFFHKFNDQVLPTLKNKSAPNTLTKKQGISVTREEWARMKPKARAEYLLRLRFLQESADKVLTYMEGSTTTSDNRNWLDLLLRGEEAFAIVRTGEMCIYAGYISTYGPKAGGTGLTCKEPEVRDTACPRNTQSCNKVVYSVDREGKEYCVPKSPTPVRHAATQNCNRVSPLVVDNLPPDERAKISDPEKYKQDNINRLLRSYLNLGNDIVFEQEGPNKGKAKRDQFSYNELTKINEHIARLKTLIVQTNPHCDRKDIPADQVQACTELRTRGYELETFLITGIGDGGTTTNPVGDRCATTPRPADCPVTSPGGDGGQHKCDALDNGTTWSAEVQDCICAPPFQELITAGTKACVPPAASCMSNPKPSHCPSGEVTVPSEDECKKDPKPKSCERPAVAAFNWKKLIPPLTVGALFIAAGYFAKDILKPQQNPQPLAVPPPLTNPTTTNNGGGTIINPPPATAPQTETPTNSSPTTTPASGARNVK